MTPTQFVTQNNGKYIGSGQCGELVDLWLVEGFGNHTEYATAYDYWLNGIPGFSVISGAPQDGDIGCYGPHTGFPDGHITMHYQGEEFEQNADPDGSPAHLFPRANTYLLGYLRKGEVMETVNAGDVQNIYKALLKRDATPADDGVWVGKDWKTFTYGVIDSAEFQNLQNPATTLTPGNYVVPS